MFVYKNTNFIGIVRAIADLKYGIPIILHSKNKRILVVPVDRINKGLFVKLKSAFPDIYLIVTKQRANFLSGSIAFSNNKISCRNMTYDEMQNTVFDLSPKKSKQSFICSTKLEDQALKLLKFAELIPAILSIEVDSDFKMDFTINHLNASHIDDYLPHINDAIEEVCSADLNLKLAKGKIKTFRSEFSKDHYAIIIYPKKQNLTIPLVRIHSSCFTGDLLASIKCDCFDQLQNAIKIMSEKDGGIILYLNQEGRGIGLTNKIRVYKAQSLGFDTVEANENLGLEGDLRGFSIAAKILKSLGINKIKLLSNNPNKARNLITGGIEVKSMLPHQFCNKEIKKYYQIKAKKLNHKIDY